MKPSEKRIAKGLWWDRNWPVLEGCTPCSPACDNCFAAKYAHRFKDSLPSLRGLTNQEGKWNGMVMICRDQLKLPSTIKKPTVWFVTERSDLFHPLVPFGYIQAVLTYAAMAPHHRYMILTKRPERMAEFFQWMNSESTYSVETLQDCFWFGVTVWDQASADRSIPILCGLQVAHKFISIEPMLGPVNILRHCNREAAAHSRFRPVPCVDLVICGGESGHEARALSPEWVNFLRYQCTDAKIPFFFKQWGEWSHQSQADFTSSPFTALSSRNAMYHVWGDGTRSYRVGKKAAGRLLDGKEHMEFPGESECAQ